MTHLCIDTNIFISLYQKAGIKIEIFPKLMEITESIVFPEQIFNEFRRNRAKVIHGIINGMKVRFKEEIPIYPNTLLYQSFAKRTELNQKYYDLKRFHDETLEYFNKLIKNPQDDLVYNFVSGLYNDTNTTRIRIDTDIIESAKTRNFLGNPPFSEGNSKGDELIFESLLSVCTEDLIIVTTDDKGFKIHEQYLKEEYCSKTGMTLTVINDLTSAMETLGKGSTTEIKEFDNARIIGSLGVASPSGSEFPTGGVYISFPTVGGGCINLSPTSYPNDGTVSDLNNYRPGKESEFP